MKIYKLYEAESPIENHIYVDDNTGKRYIFNGESLIELPENSNSSNGGDSSQNDNSDSKKDSLNRDNLKDRLPQIGDKPDEDELAKEDAEREAQARKEAEEDGESLETEEERQARLDRIKKLMSDEGTKDMANYESEQAVKQDKQKRIKAEKDRELKKRLAGRNTAAIQAFTRDLKTFVANQVAKEVVTSTWRKYNSNYAGSGIIKQGHRTEKVGKIPLINVYLDQSGSWGPQDVEIGLDALASLYGYEKKGLIKLQVYYFSNHLHSSAEEARQEGGTGAGAEMMQHIADTKPMNVVVMTDDDFDSWGLGNLNITVPGAAWLLFRNFRSEKLMNQLKGKKHTKIYDI